MSEKEPRSGMILIGVGFRIHCRKTVKNPWHFILPYLDNSQCNQLSNNRYRCVVEYRHIQFKNDNDSICPMPEVTTLQPTGFKFHSKRSYVVRDTKASIYYETGVIIRD